MGLKVKSAFAEEGVGEDGGASCRGCMMGIGCVWGMGNPTPAHLTGRERSWRSGGGVPWVGSVPRRAGRKNWEIAASTGAKSGPMPPVARWRCIHSDCRLFCSHAKAHWGEVLATLERAFTPSAHPATFFFTQWSHSSSVPMCPPK